MSFGPARLYSGPFPAIFTKYGRCDSCCPQLRNISDCENYEYFVLNVVQGKVETSKSITLTSVEHTIRLNKSLTLAMCDVMIYTKHSFSTHQ